LYWVNKSATTETDKKQQQEKLKTITDDLHKFLKLYSQNITTARQQKIDLLTLNKKVAKEKRLQHESDVGFIDTDQTAY